MQREGIRYVPRTHAPLTSGTHARIPSRMRERTYIIYSAARGRMFADGGPRALFCGLGRARADTPAQLSTPL